MTSVIPQQETAPESEPVVVHISDLDIVRMGLGPQWGGDAITAGAIRRIGVIGRGILQRELPALLDRTVQVRPTLLTTKLELPKGLIAARVRQGIAHLLENDETVQHSMVGLKVEQGSGEGWGQLDDDIARVLRGVDEGTDDESLREMIAEAPEPALLRRIQDARQGRLDRNHVGEFRLMPMEALLLEIWASDIEELEHERMGRAGYLGFAWERTAMLEMLLSATPASWGPLFGRVVERDPSVALTALQEQIWPEGFQPAQKDFAPLMRCSDSGVRTQAIPVIRDLLSGFARPTSADTAGGQGRRVPRRIGAG